MEEECDVWKRSVMCERGSCVGEVVMCLRGLVCRRGLMCGRKF